MKETGIIMSGNHPRLIIDGLKTMTRRTWGLEEINRNPDAWEWIGYDNSGRFSFRFKYGDRIVNVRCPYSGVGDLLWVRENWSIHWIDNNGEAELRVYYFGGSYKVVSRDKAKLIYMHSSGRPSIHLPRWASRVTREITGLRAERLQEITEEDAEAEGLRSHIEDFQPGCSYMVEAREKFERLWDSLNAKRGYGWETNPWVWVISWSKYSIKKT